MSALRATGGRCIFTPLQYVYHKYPSYDSMFSRLLSMLIQEITVKACLTKSKLTDYVINPYVGCQHACHYCYAVFMKRFQNIAEPWGEFVHVKMNCPELLAGELKKNRPGNIWLSSVTDAYHPIEAKYRLTRRILETICDSPYRSKFTLELLTKSSLVKRDFDLLQTLPVELGCSINSLDAHVARVVEPLAAPPQDRIAVLRAAQAEGLRVYGFISPVIPGLTKLEEIFERLNFCEYVWVELLNTKPSVLNRLLPTLRQHFPSQYPEIQRYLRYPARYFEQIKAQVDELHRKHGVEVRGVVRHD